MRRLILITLALLVLGLQSGFALAQAGDYISVENRARDTQQLDGAWEHAVNNVAAIGSFSIDAPGEDYAVLCSVRLRPLIEVVANRRPADDALPCSALPPRLLRPPLPA